ncbi:L,D-transpeptidase family protein [Akkermansiaceae bacterium]|nr:L,D-transpeptidase family protein [Akkermansiaceae bacterium]
MKIILFSLSTLSLFLTQCSPNAITGNPLVSGGTQYLAGYEPTVSGDANGQSGGYWDGDGVTGTPKIRINRAEQKAYFYKGAELVGVSPISSGSSTHTTPAGSYKVTERDVDHTSSLYGVIKNVATGEIVNDEADTRKHKAKAGEVFIHAPMLNFLRFNGAIGMHTGFLPGYPASHGCVRLPEAMAQKFYQNAKIGTPVIVE